MAQAVQVYHFILLHFLFVNDTATTQIYTLSLHDALPIFAASSSTASRSPNTCATRFWSAASIGAPASAASTARSEEHTSELQSQSNLVCRLLLEKKNI